MAYNFETNEIPNLFILRPVYDNASTEAAFTGAAGQFNYGKRLKNGSTPFDSVMTDTKSFAVDMFVTNKSVSVPGVGSMTYRQVANAIKLVGDAERALQP
jgi:hypothetical protein